MSFLKQLQSTGAAASTKQGGLLNEIAAQKGLLSVAEGTAEGALFGYKGAPVGWSHDLERILNLPRRDLDPENDLRAAEAWTKHLRREREDQCDCDSRWGVRGPDGQILPGSGCLKSFNGVQGWSFEEASDYKTVWGNIGVGHGKALALDTPIPTPYGWATMGALQVGDFVIDSQGKPCRVTYATEIQHNRECFEVRFSDGSTIIADADHRWVTRSYLERRQLDRGAKKGFGPSVRTTKEIAASLLHRHNKNHAVDVAGALELPHQILPMDPYLLGAWLGDGSTGKGDVTSMDALILNAFDRIYDRGHNYPSGQATTQYYRGLLGDLKLAGVASNKHVPSMFLRASAAQRLALLQGLMDTDGHAQKDSVVEFCNTNKALADAVFELAASLGQQPKMYFGRATIYGKDCGEKYRVCWQPTINVFRLPRKRDRLRLGRYKQSQIKARRYIEAITPIPSVPVRCITVDSPDHTYLCGRAMIPTHNTGIALFLGMAIPGIETVTILMPTQVKRQFVERDYPQWAAHFKVPHLAGYHTWPDRRPVIRIVTYHELQLPKNSDLLTRYGVADLIVADEAHNLKDKKGTRWKRLKRAYDTKPFHFVCLTGTPTDKSIKEYAHLIGLAMGDRSPLPLHHPTVDAWASAIDAGCLAPMGKLSLLCKPGEAVQEGFARRVSETHACIVTSSASVKCALSITAVKAPEVPERLQKFIEGTRHGQRPDGEEALEMLTSARWARQLAAGFYSYWNFPRCEPDALIQKWLLKRKEYHKEGREALKHSKDFADSPMLLWNAAARWHDGYTHDGKEYPPHCQSGPMPVWKSETFLAWREIKDKVFHETRYKWESDYLVDATVDWARKNVGLIWVEHKDFGQRVADKAGIPFYDGGGKNPELEEKGDRSVVLAVKANDTGKNLQKLWHRNLYPNPFSSNKRWEQCLDSQTEILTSEGWKGIDDPKTGLVAAYDITTGRIQWEPFRPMERTLDGEGVYSITGPQIDLRVTAGHRMVVSVPKHVSQKQQLKWSDFQFVEAKDLPKCVRIPLCGNADFSGVPLSNMELFFLGLFLTDGNLEPNGRVSLFQSEEHPRVIEAIDSCLRELGLPAEKIPNDQPSNFGPRKHRLWKWRIPSRYLSKLRPWLKKDMPNLENITAAQLPWLLWGMWCGDGAKTPGTYTNDRYSPQTLKIYSRRRVVLDKLQQMCVLRGFSAALSENRPNFYSLHFSQRQWHTIHTRASDARPVWQRSEGDPKERFWCCSVSTQAIITRRNGRVTVVGNSIGRTHRNGQPQDEVFVETFLHTPEMRRAFDTACARAAYVQNTGKNPQKLVYAKKDLSEAVEDLRVPTEGVTRWFESEEW